MLWPRNSRSPKMISFDCKWNSTRSVVMLLCIVNKTDKWSTRCKTNWRNSTSSSKTPPWPVIAKWRLFKVISNKCDNRNSCKFTRTSNWRLNWNWPKTIEINWNVIWSNPIDAFESTKRISPYNAKKFKISNDTFKTNNAIKNSRCIPMKICARSWRVQKTKRSIFVKSWKKRNNGSWVNMPTLDNRLIVESSCFLVLDEQKAQCQKDANELRHNLREVERSRLEARRELQELRRHVKLLDGETKKKSKEVEELADRVRQDEHREDEMRREVFGQKQRFVEAEASREVLRKELANIQRHYVELEDEQRMKDRDFKLAVEDARRLGKNSRRISSDHIFLRGYLERKAIDERRNVELALEGANQMISELRIALSGAEGRASALDTQLARYAISSQSPFLSSTSCSLQRGRGQTWCWIQTRQYCLELTPYHWLWATRREWWWLTQPITKSECSSSTDFTNARLRYQRKPGLTHSSTCITQSTSTIAVKWCRWWSWPISGFDLRRCGRYRSWTDSISVERIRSELHHHRTWTRWLCWWVREARSQAKQDDDLSF